MHTHTHTHTYTHTSHEECCFRAIVLSRERGWGVFHGWFVIRAQENVLQCTTQWLCAQTPCSLLCLFQDECAVGRVLRGGRPPILLHRTVGMHPELPERASASRDVPGEPLQQTSHHGGPAAYDGAGHWSHGKIRPCNRVDSKSCIKTQHKTAWFKRKRTVCFQSERAAWFQSKRTGWF